VLIDLPYRDAPDGTLRVDLDAVRVIAQCSGLYLVALDGRAEDLAPSVVYTPRLTPDLYRACPARRAS
jgi:hypothetical protein